MPSAYPIDPNSNQSLADKNNDNRLGNFQAQQKPDDHVVATSGINPYYSPGMHAANPISNSTAAESTGKPIMLNPIAPPVPSATPNITLNSGFQSGNSPAPFGTLSPIASPTPSNLTINPTFQSGNPGQAPLAGASASPAVTSLPPTTTLTPNAGIANGLVEPHATASMKITPQNGIINGMQLPSSAVNPAAPATDWNAKFLKETGTAFDPHSKMDLLNMNRLKGMAPVGKGEDTTLNHAQYRAGQYSR